MFQLLHPETSIAAGISQWQCFILQCQPVQDPAHSQSTKLEKGSLLSPLDLCNTPIRIHTPMVAPCKMRPANSLLMGAGVFTSTTGDGNSDAITLDPGGNGPTLTINRAGLAVVLVAVQKDNTEIATDSASSLFQIRKQLWNPMAVLHHLHRELLKVCESNSILTFYHHFLQGEIPLW